MNVDAAVGAMAASAHWIPVPVLFRIWPLVPALLPAISGVVMVRADELALTAPPPKKTVLSTEPSTTAFVVTPAGSAAPRPMITLLVAILYCAKINSIHHHFWYQVVPSANSPAAPPLPIVMLPTTAVVDTGTIVAATVSGPSDMFLTIVVAPLAGAGSVSVSDAAVAVYTFANAGAWLLLKRTAATGAARQAGGTPGPSLYKASPAEPAPVLPTLSAVPPIISNMEDCTRTPAAVTIPDTLAYAR